MFKLFERNVLSVEEFSSAQTSIKVKNLHVSLNNNKVLNNISIRIPKNKITALIGQSGCGKTTLLNSFNRMNEFILSHEVSGEVWIDGRNIYDKRERVSFLRSQIGMVFQRPNPFPMSIYDNVSFGLKIQGIKNRRKLDESVEKALKKSALWDEVRDRLFDSALTLSGGQQQRLMIARALALEPKILLLDEPTSALDPLTTLYIEELMVELKKYCTIIIVTHNMQQAARVSDYAAFIHRGELVEYSDSDSIFTMPNKQQTEDYITGRYG
ncbi:phosphate ABC transporter ATP-binding protein PstB [Glaciecola petra]|uniref:Phosphate ABC transporter ATP-binding protein PstB n=1 Tax=Glaciecola petra TaxID=3075602 RepID=A0ABU2ZLH5_9ALTE|nr:phosphate ABC transporter ATP-binding protein PstB [Aestuariibacter sp. P117]MDT0593476.1 phosphate ABC transporter ATP-binding protein PstB [Aestuariibacter sp. P117]